MFPPGTLIHNRYRIVGQIGQGGFGAIYEAIDQRVDRRVALKQLLLADANVSRQFQREARLLANLEHPMLPRVTDYFTDASGQFLVMDFVPGDDLAVILNKQATPFPVDQVLAWADQLLDVLDYLHSHTPPIIHRDIKPHNLKLRPNGRVMLLDFGLAKGEAGYARAISQQRSILGYTRGYAALEQIEGAGTDERTDLYSLGATLYCLLTKAPPMDSETRALVLKNSGRDPVKLLHGLSSQVPEEVSRVVMQALALKPDERPQSAQGMRRLLEEARATGARPEAGRPSQQEDTIAPPLVAPPVKAAIRQDWGNRMWLWAIAVGLSTCLVLFVGLWALNPRSLGSPGTLPNAAASSSRTPSTVALAALPTDTLTPPPPPPTNTPAPVAGVGTSTVPTDRIAVNGWVQVTSNNGLRIRAEPATSATIVDRLPGGFKARVIDGPQESGGFTWWKVDRYKKDDPTASGWCIDDLLVPTTAP